LEQRVNAEIDHEKVSAEESAAKADLDRERARARRQIRGVVAWDDQSGPVAGAKVHLFTRGSAQAIAAAKSDHRGAFAVEIGEDDDLGPLDVYATVFDVAGRQLVATADSPFVVDGRSCRIQLAVPAQYRMRDVRGVRPQVLVGPIQLDAQRVERAEPEIALAIARAMVDPEVDPEQLERIAALSPDLVPSTHVKHTLCGTSILRTIDELIRLKRWPREIGLEVDRLLRRQGFGYTSATYLCPNFTINYFVDGPDAVDPDTTSQTVLDPGTTTVLATLAAGAPPTYVKRVCFWLERALATYTSPPFSLKNPAASGRIPVYLNSSPYGSAGATAFYLNKALVPDLLCAVAVHELFHMVQFQYGGSGTWYQSMLEGGAVWAEDTNTEMMNRYLDEAGTNFNGTGVQAMPQTSLEAASYKCSLFWRYVSEQQSALPTAADEPLPLTVGNIGVDVYRQLIETCAAGTFSADDVKTAIRQLPWYQDFYDFGYLDAARTDLTSSETALGNYVLACYLKDLDENVPDRRFDFMEGQETIYMDEVIGEPPQPGDKLASVTFAGTGNLTAAGSLSFANSVPRFGSRFFEVTVDPGVTSVQVQFTASPGLASSLFQIVVIDGAGLVREIYRSDKSSYTKQFPNSRGGQLISKIMCVATGAASSGNFSVSVSPVAVAPDVMVTRWNSALGFEYEVDSRNWSWTWVSPDVWVDNDGDGIADSQVFFNYDNQLYIRLHNNGNAGAAGISVQLDYQDASGGLSPTGWLPVQDKLGTTQSLTGLALAAGATNQWSVNWSPVPSGASHHFCIRAIVTAPGDPNTDNKRVLSNFGNVVVKYGGFVDIALLRRNIDLLLERRIELSVIPRLSPDLELAGRDLLQERSRVLEPGQTSRDLIRVRHTPGVRQLVHDEGSMRSAEPCPPSAPPIRTSPDPWGHYPPDPRTLPPGVEGRPMITIAHLVDGLPTGGVTVLVTVENDGGDTR
jgi:hypothetical protein